jgi:hypothetical protein
MQYERAGGTLAGSDLISSLVGLIRPVLAPFLFSRLLVLMMALFLEWLLATGRAIKYDYIGDAPLATLSMTFDGNWYAGIASSGYSASPDVATAQNYAFFPLYPFLMRLAGDLAGLGGSTGGYAVTGLVLSHLFFLGALALLYRLTLLGWADPAFATRTVWAISALPWAYVFSMTYTESLFLLLAVGAVLVAYRGRSKPGPGVALGAGLLAALAALTRPQGLLVVLPVVWLLTSQQLLSPRARAIYTALSSLPALSAAGAYVLYIGLSTGNMVAALQAKTAWGQSWVENIGRVLVLPPGNPMWFVDSVSLLGLIAWTLLTLAAVRWFRARNEERIPVAGQPAVQRTAGWGFVIYACAYFLITLSGTPANASWGRYMLAVFPCVWAIAWPAYSRPLYQRLLIYLFAAQDLLLAAAVLAQVTP